MDTKKLDKWADLLLDTGKRNNLINFKDTRASTVEVLLPSPDALFEKVDGTTFFEVFDPKIAEDDEPEESFDPEQLQIETREAPDASGGKTAFLAQYSGKIKRQNQILLYNAATNPLTAVKNIDKKAREFIEETGVNVAYMAYRTKTYCRRIPKAILLSMDRFDFVRESCSVCIQSNFSG